MGALPLATAGLSALPGLPFSGPASRDSASAKGTSGVTAFDVLEPVREDRGFLRIHPAAVSNKHSGGTVGARHPIGMTY